MTEGDTVPTLRKLPRLGGVNSYRWGGVSIPLGQQGWANEVTVVSTHLGLMNALMLCGEGSAKAGRPHTLSPSW